MIKGLKRENNVRSAQMRGGNEGKEEPEEEPGRLLYQPSGEGDGRPNHSGAGGKGEKARTSHLSGCKSQWVGDWLRQ